MPRATRRGRDRLPLEFFRKRDGDLCWVCCLPVMGHGIHPTPAKLSPTRDHVVPLSEGGADEPGNIRLAHRLCNKARAHHGSAALRGMVERSMRQAVRKRGVPRLWLAALEQEGGGE